MRFSSLRAGSGFHSSFYLQLFLQLACDWDIHGDVWFKASVLLWPEKYAKFLQLSSMASCCVSGHPQPLFFFAWCTTE